MKKIVCITGTRPQLIKHSVLIKDLKQYFFVESLYTGQHYQYELNGLLKKDLLNDEIFHEIKLSAAEKPAFRLASMIAGISTFLDKSQPDGVLVYGDTDTTLAGALSANKMNLQLIHVEAGERSFNNSMPEETNRILTDALSHFLFCSSEISLQNLKKENNNSNTILSGDLMKDLLIQTAGKLSNPIIQEPYIFCTIHRDYNKNNNYKLRQLIQVLTSLNYSIIFPVHPATMVTINSLGLKIINNKYENIHFLMPLTYTESIHYQKFAIAIITDSGGIQKEAYWLKVPCITFRKETEWIETLKGNWNQLVYEDINSLKELLVQPTSNHNENLYGSGNAAEKIAKSLYHLLS